MLLLKKHLVDLVRAGKKRQTIRYWSRPIVFAGQISFTPGLGKMKILRVEELAGYQSLTLTDARDDGFETLEDLLAELKRNYPEVPPGKRLYRVVFKWPIEAPVPPQPPADQTVARTAESTVSEPPLEKPARKLTAKTPKSASSLASAPMPATAADSCMSIPQRQLLRNWVIAQTPKSDFSSLSK
ncbi:MAG: ASCH domain-containing protein [Phycisphaerae bacterium]